MITTPGRMLSPFIVATGLAMAVPAFASPLTTLTFEGINATYPTQNFHTALVQDFYNGGTSSDGTSGPDYGVAFSSTAVALCLNTLSGTCSGTSRGGLGDPDSQQGALYFPDRPQGAISDVVFMNVPGGFDIEFGVYYVSASAFGAIEIYDGLEGTGTQLAALTLSPNAVGCAPVYGAGFCPFQPESITFSGIARSVAFIGVTSSIAFDDIHFGSATPGGGDVPEPTSLALFGLGAVGLASLHRRKA